MQNAGEIHDSGLGELVESLGASGFDNSFFRFANRQLNISDCTTFLFGTLPPSIVVARGRGIRSNAAKEAADHYIGEAHTKDATRAALNKALEQKDVVWRRVSRESIRDASYRARFFDDLDIVEKLSMMAKVDAGALYFNFYRASSQRPFDASDLSVLKRISGVTVSAVRKHLSLMHQFATVEATEDCLERVQRVLKKRACLTRREIDVCSHVVLGRSTAAIAQLLGIAPDTVGTHRKRAYARLGIASQNQLFAICMDGFR